MGNKQVVTNCFEEYLMSVFKDIINRCNKSILEATNTFSSGGHNIQHQRANKCENDTSHHGYNESKGLL